MKKSTGKKAMRRALRLEWNEAIEAAAARLHRPELPNAEARKILAQVYAEVLALKKQTVTS